MLVAHASPAHLAGKSFTNQLDDIIDWVKSLSPTEMSLASLWCRPRVTERETQLASAVENSLDLNWTMQLMRARHDAGLIEHWRTITGSNDMLTPAIEALRPLESAVHNVLAGRFAPQPLADLAVDQELSLLYEEILILIAEYRSTRPVAEFADSLLEGWEGSAAELIAIAKMTAAHATAAP